VPYRDDRQALALELQALEHENQRLREELGALTRRFRDLVRERHDLRRSSARESCALCGGTLLPVAIFAGHDISQPLPLNLSTLRFSAKSGGFTHSAALQAYACTSCGFIHSFIDMTGAVREAQDRDDRDRDQDAPPAEAEDDGREGIQ
jgi:hypothetical protein